MIIKLFSFHDRPLSFFDITSCSLLFPYVNKFFALSLTMFLFPVYLSTHVCVSMALIYNRRFHNSKKGLATKKRKTSKDKETIDIKTDASK
jgi:hypothetical protein